MRMHDEFSGTITLTENSSRELFKVLQEQDEAFINDVLCGRCGFTLKSADGRSVELVPNTNKRCQSVESVEADTPQTDAEIPINALRSDCTGCRFVGWYDTDFPCANCVRKNKDYYDAEQTERNSE